MSMLPPGPPGPAVEGYVKETRTVGVMQRVAVFFHAERNSKQEWRVDYIARHVKLRHSQVQGTLTRLRKLGIAIPGSRMGTWAVGPNADRALELTQRGVGTAMYAAAARQDHTSNGVEPQPTKSIQRQQAEAAGLHESDLLEVLRVRLDGSVVSVSADGELWHCIHIDI